MAKLIKALPHKLLLAIIITWPLGQLLSLPSLNDSVHWHLLDLLTLALFLLLPFTAGKRLLKDPLTKYLALFVFAAFLSLLVNLPSLGLRISFLSSFYLFRFLSLLSVYYAAKLYLRPADFSWIFFSISLFLVLGLAQYIFLPDTRFLRYLGFDDHFARLIGTTLDPNFTGALLAAFTLFFLSLPRKYLSLALISLLALSLTFSRASYISFLAGLLVLIIQKKNYFLLLPLLLLPLLLLVIPKPSGEGVNLLRTYSISSRLTNQSAALNLALQKPIFGHGFNSLKFTTDQSLFPNRQGGVDNSLLFVLATTGLVGLVTYLLLLLKIGRLLSPNPAFLAIYINFLVHSLFNNSLFYIFILIPLLLILGIASRRKAHPN